MGSRVRGPAAGGGVTLEGNSRMEGCMRYWTCSMWAAAGAPACAPGFRIQGLAFATGRDAAVLRWSAGARSLTWMLSRHPALAAPWQSRHAAACALPTLTASALTEPSADGAQLVQTAGIANRVLFCSTAALSQVLKEGLKTA